MARLPAFTLIDVPATEAEFRKLLAAEILRLRDTPNPADFERVAAFARKGFAALRREWNSHTRDRDADLHLFWFRCEDAYAAIYSPSFPSRAAALKAALAGYAPTTEEAKSDAQASAQRTAASERLGKVHDRLAADLGVRYSTPRSGIEGKKV